MERFNGLCPSPHDLRYQTALTKTQSQPHGLPSHPIRVAPTCCLTVVRCNHDHCQPEPRGWGRRIIICPRTLPGPDLVLLILATPSAYLARRNSASRASLPCPLSIQHSRQHRRLPQETVRSSVRATFATSTDEEAGWSSGLGALFEEPRPAE